MKSRLLLIALLASYTVYGQTNVELLEIIDIVKTSNVETQIKNVFNGKIIEHKEVYIPPYNLDSKTYEIDDFKICNGVCDGFSIYSNRNDFVQLEMSFQRVNASLNDLKRTRGLEYITSGDFYNGKAIAVNYLFKYYGFAINVVTLKESQRMGSFYVSSDDVFFITITTIHHYNKTMSDHYGVKL